MACMIASRSPLGWRLGHTTENLRRDDDILRRAPSAFASMVSDSQLRTRWRW